VVGDEILSAGIVLIGDCVVFTVYQDAIGPRRNSLLRGLVIYLRIHFEFVGWHKVYVPIKINVLLLILS